MISLSDLPLEYQQQAAEKILSATRGKQVRHGVTTPTAQGQAERSERKYHSCPDTRITSSGNILRFDSQKEARRYDELCLLLKDGKIRNLRLQVDFTLQEAYTGTDGNRIRAIRYRADFTYDEHAENGWKNVVEDVKGKRTPEYQIKKKMMLDRFGIHIRET